ncbi:MAG: hypothetical protein NVS4B8_01400 [Herpetosiphon sp.]
MPTTDPATALQSTGWGVYKDIMINGTTVVPDVGPATAPSLDGQSFKCGIAGGDRYNNIFCNNTIAKSWSGNPWPYRSAELLVYHLAFYVDGTIDCTTPNRSTIEGLEFAWEHTIMPERYVFAVQWQKNGQWRFWNARNDPATGRPYGWLNFPVPLSFCFASRQWHTITLRGQMTGSDYTYLSMTLDGQTYPLGGRAGTAPAPSGWAENFLQVAVQVDGDTAINGSPTVDPVAVYIDRVTLTCHRADRVFLPSIMH